MTREGMAKFSRSSIPDPEGAIIGGGEEPRAIGTDGTGIYKASMAGEHVAKLSRSSIPDPEGAIIGGGEEPGAIGADGTGVYRAGMAGERSFQGIHWEIR
jgi:hypothetical protein